MALIPLTLDALKDLDNGKVDAAFQRELRHAIADCMDRPGDANARTVGLAAKITPVVDDDGSCSGACVEFTVKSKVPDRKSRPYSFGINKKGHLFFSDESPENVGQYTFSDVNPATGRAERKERD